MIFTIKTNLKIEFGLAPSNFDWGANLGAGFKSDAGLSLGARYHMGQNDIYDKDKPKNRVWQIYVGFEF